MFTRVFGLIRSRLRQQVTRGWKAGQARLLDRPWGPWGNRSQGTHGILENRVDCVACPGIVEGEILTHDKEPRPRRLSVSPAPHGSLSLAGPPFCGLPSTLISHRSFLQWGSYWQRREEQAAQVTVAFNVGSATMGLTW